MGDLGSGITRKGHDVRRRHGPAPRTARRERRGIEALLHLSDADLPVGAVVQGEDGAVRLEEGLRRPDEAGGAVEVPVERGHGGEALEAEQH